MNRSRYPAAFLAILVVSTFLATSAGAFEPGDVQITPVIGLYTATADNLDETIPGLGSVTARRSDALTAGARLTFWTRPSLGFELAGVYSSGTLDGQAFGFEGQMDASSFFGSARLVLSPGSSDATRLLLSGGLVLVSQSYEFVDGSSFMAGVVGLGLHVPFSESVALRLDADDYIYNAWWELDDARSTTRLQNDVVATVGLSFTMGK